MELRDGERVAVVGSNGAGKTTLLRVLAGVLPPTSGQVDLRPETLNLLGDATASLNPEVSGRENLLELFVIYGLHLEDAKSRLANAERVVDIGERILDPVYTYSAGMQTRLRLAVLFQLEPKVIILDEGIGLADRSFTVRNASKLNDLIDRTPVVVIASHSHDLLTRYCSRGIVLSAGRVSADGPITEILDSYQASP
jgi:ABC-type polysaccharide/polyol phosphate transport system ATPase subunit